MKLKSRKQRMVRHRIRIFICSINSGVKLIVNIECVFQTPTLKGLIRQTITLLMTNPTLIKGFFYFFFLGTFFLIILHLRVGTTWSPNQIPSIIGLKYCLLNLGCNCIGSSSKWERFSSINLESFFGMLFAPMKVKRRTHKTAKHRIKAFIVDCRGYSHWRRPLLINQALWTLQGSLTVLLPLKQISRVYWWRAMTLRL